MVTFSVNLASIFGVLAWKRGKCYWSDQDGDDVPNSDQEETRCKGERRDSEHEGEGTDGEGEEWCDERERAGISLDRQPGETTTEGYTRVDSEENGWECRLGIGEKQVLGHLGQLKCHLIQRK